MYGAFVFPVLIILTLIDLVHVCLHGRLYVHMPTSALSTPPRARRLARAVSPCTLDDNDETRRETPASRRRQSTRCHHFLATLRTPPRAAVSRAPQACFLAHTASLCTRDGDDETRRQQASRRRPSTHRRCCHHLPPPLARHHKPGVSRAL